MRTPVLRPIVVVFCYFVNANRYLLIVALEFLSIIYCNLSYIFYVQVID